MSPLWLDRVKPEFENQRILSAKVNRTEKIKNIRKLRKIIGFTAVPLWIFSAILLAPTLIDYYNPVTNISTSLLGSYFWIGIVLGILGDAVIVIGLVQLSDVRQILDVSYFTEKQTQFS